MNRLSSFISFKNSTNPAKVYCDGPPNQNTGVLALEPVPENKELLLGLPGTATVTPIPDEFPQSPAAIISWPPSNPEIPSPLSQLIHIRPEMAAAIDGRTEEIKELFEDATAATLVDWQRLDRAEGFLCQIKNHPNSDEEFVLNRYFKTLYTTTLESQLKNEFLKFQELSDPGTVSLRTFLQDKMTPQLAQFHESDTYRCHWFNTLFGIMKKAEGLPAIEKRDAFYHLLKELQTGILLAIVSPLLTPSNQSHREYCEGLLAPESKSNLIEAVVVSLQGNGADITGIELECSDVMFPFLEKSLGIPKGRLELFRDFEYSIES